MNKFSKILYITNAKIPTPKAHGYQIFVTCSAMVAEGRSVTLWVPAKRAVQGADPFSFYELPPAFEVKKIFTIELPEFGALSHFVSYWVQVLSFYFFASLRLLFYPRQTLIYTRDYWPLFFRLLGFTVVVETHRIPEHFTRLFFYVSKLAYRIVVVTQHLQQCYAQHGFNASRVIVAPDGVDLSVFSSVMNKNDARTALNLPHDQRIILYSGRFTTMGMDKGIADVLRALSTTPSSVIFVAVGGDDTEIAMYRAIAKKIGVESRVRLFSRVSRPAVALYHHAADVLVMPFPFTSHYAYYMSPLKMFEYMASDRPIIATDLPSVREVLNEKNALLVSPGDPESLAIGMMRLLNDTALSARLASEARRNVSAYTWDHRVQRILGGVDKE